MPELEFEVSKIFGMIMQPTLSFMSYPMEFEVSKYFIFWPLEFDSGTFDSDDRMAESNF